MATIHDILSFAYPDRGGWTVHGNHIAAGDGGSVPTLEEIESHREAAEEDLAEKAEAIVARKIWHDSAHFLQSFSLAETAAISISSDSTIAALRLILATWRSEIWSDDPRIVAGLDALVAAQIITTQRREAIIAK
jgi:hypothetical protein